MGPLFLPSERIAMMRVAVFVDAGYLYAAGSASLLGTSATREMTDLNQSKTIAALRSTALEKANDAQLLRIYWYDGVLPQGPSPEQRRIADADDVKLRLGIVTPHGQKGVDSLIVTDLVELARNGAISDAVLMSGDEDVRIGVQIAQSFGVRVHLVGIEPRHNNQSRALMQESDTATEWSKSIIERIMTSRAGFDAGAVEGGAPAIDAQSDIAPVLDEVVAELVSALSPDEIQAIAILLPREKVPREYDRQLLRRSSQRVGSFLSDTERDYLRSRLKAAARDSASDTDSGSGE